MIQVIALAGLVVIIEGTATKPTTAELWSTLMIGLPEARARWRRAVVIPGISCKGTSLARCTEVRAILRKVSDDALNRTDHDCVTDLEPLLLVIQKVAPEPSTADWTAH